MTAAPARLSARSLPETPECPGLKTHVSFSRELSWRVLNQSAYKSSFFTFCRVLIESVTITAFFMPCCCRYFKASDMAFISISILDVVMSTAPESSAIVAPLTRIVNAQPDFSPLLTEPSVNTMASSSELFCWISSSTALSVSV